MKKIMSFILASLLVFASGCERNKVNNTADKNAPMTVKVKIVATIFPLYDIALQIAGDKAEVEMLLPVGAEVHSYEPTSRDIIKIRESNLFINIGLSADPWTEAIIDDVKSEHFNVISVGEIVGHEHDDDDDDDDHNHDDDDHNHSFDEHVWTSIENVEEIAEGVFRRLCEIDPENTAYYRVNYEAYEKQLEILDEKFERAIEASRNKTLVFADRFPFLYFTEEYDLDYIAAFPGCSSETEPSAATVSQIIDFVRKNNIKAVLYTETSNGKVPDIICEETGAQKLLMHSCHNVTKKQLDEGITYLQLMENNLEAVKQALR